MVSRRAHNPKIAGSNPAPANLKQTVSRKQPKDACCNFLTVLALDSDFHFIMRRSETLKVKPVPEDQLLIDFRAPDVGENQLESDELGVPAALRGIGFVRANPPVGAVLVDAHRFLAVGAHLDYGHSHAEVNVLINCRRSQSQKRDSLCDAGTLFSQR